MISTLLALLALDFGLAGLFIIAFTYPVCNPNPPPIQSLPAPREEELHTADGLVLRAWYYPTRNGAAIMALDGPHGALGQSVPPVDFLVNAGYGVLQIDTRSCARPRAPVTLGGREVLDAAAGLTFLKSQPEIKKIGIFGFSMGGATAIRAAARHEEISAVVAEGGYANLGYHLASPYPTKSAPLRALRYSIAGLYQISTGENPWEISPIDDLPEVSPRPIFLIYGSLEEENGRAREQFAAAREPKTLWIVPGGYHGANHLVAPREYQRRVLGFFNQAFSSIEP